MRWGPTVYSVQEQLLALVVEESRVRQLSRDAVEREERLAMEEDGLRKKEQDLVTREKLLSDREAEVAKRETDVSLREQNFSRREERVVEMERLACEAHNSLVQCMEQEIQQRVEEMMGGQREEAEHSERCLKEKNREIQRLRKCNDGLKQANNSLKKEVSEIVLSNPGRDVCWDVLMLPAARSGREERKSVGTALWVSVSSGQPAEEE